MPSFKATAPYLGIETWGSRIIRIFQQFSLQNSFIRDAMYSKLSNYHCKYLSGMVLQFNKGDVKSITKRLSLGFSGVLNRCVIDS